MDPMHTTTGGSEITARASFLPKFPTESYINRKTLLSRTVFYLEFITTANHCIENIIQSFLNDRKWGG